MLPITVAKSKLRQEIKQRLVAMTVEERKRQSAVVTEKVLSSPEYKRSQRVCLYLSMPDEVSTLDILKDVFKSGKTCYVPRYTKTEMQMLRLFSFEDYVNLPLTKWNIKQPDLSQERDEALAPASNGLDLILVPGLAFTAQGYRLGRGKGYYDVYLKKCSLTPSPPVSIGLAFKEQIVDYIPTTDLDCTIGTIFSDE